MRGLRSLWQASLGGSLRSVGRLGRRLRALAGPAITVLIAVLAVAVMRWMWFHYEVAPWTRDGRVRADIVGVAPDEAGWVMSVAVRDNQRVNKGDTLFRLDAARYEVVVRQSTAALEHERAVLAEARREARRNAHLGNLVAEETREQSASRVAEAQANLERDLANLAAARLDLERTVVRAPVSGVVTNLELRPGDYLMPGRVALALLDADSLHVDGYFEETKLRHIREGDRVSLRLMGEERLIYGHVESIAPAIDDRERTPTDNRVANINPTFSWVRLAQRIPVRIKLDRDVQDVRLVAGRTVTVVDLAFGDVAARRADVWWRIEP